MTDSCDKFFYSRLKPLLKIKQPDGEEIQLRVGQDAKKKFCERIELQIDNDINQLIWDKLPKKSNGDLKRITFQEEDFSNIYVTKGVKSKYIKSSTIKEKLVHGEQRLRVAGNAKEEFNRFLNNSVEKAVEKAILRLPHGTKGSHKGELKRITFHEEDFP